MADEPGPVDFSTMQLGWIRQLQAIAQNGLTYAKDQYDIERYAAVRQIASEMAAWLSAGSLETVHRMFQDERGHATPKVDVRGAVINGDGILLVKERTDNRWTLPGGWADVGEAPSEAVVREVYEESGYIVQAARLLALYDRDKHGHPPHPFHIYKLFFLCEITGGAAATSAETSDVAFFPKHGIPELSVGRVTAAQIARCFEFFRHPEWPTAFD